MAPAASPAAPAFFLSPEGLLAVGVRTAPDVLDRLRPVGVCDPSDESFLPGPAPHLRGVLDPEVTAESSAAEWNDLSGWPDAQLRSGASRSLSEPGFLGLDRLRGPVRLPFHVPLAEAGPPVEPRGVLLPAGTASSVLRDDESGDAGVGTVASIGGHGSPFFLASCS